MGIFRRPRESAPAPVAPAIAEFWEWWAQARPQVEAALSAAPSEAGPSEPGPNETGPSEAAAFDTAASETAPSDDLSAEIGDDFAADDPDKTEDKTEDGSALTAELFEEIDRRLHTIHPDLLWELGHRGETPTLTVTGGGDPELRGLTERWRRAAPSGDGWRYFPARQLDPEMLTTTLSLGEYDFDLNYVKVGMRADTSRARVHVSVYHPDFLFVPEEIQVQVAYHVLHWALGEDDVARWIGDVQLATDEPMDALQPAMLPVVVEQVSEPFEEPTWLSGEGRTPRGHPAQLRVRFPVHRQDHPLCDVHVEVTLPYAQSNPDRLPVGSSAKALRGFEEKLTKLQDRGGLVLTLRVTGDGARSFHLYADPDSGVVAELDQLAAGWTEGRAKVVSTPDPAWRALQPYQP